MRVIAGTIITLAFIVGFSYLIHRISRQRRLDPQDMRWEIEEQSDGEQLIVYATRGRRTRGGGEKLLVGAVPFAAENFEQLIEDVRARANSKLVALNNRRGLNR